MKNEGGLLEHMLFQTKIKALPKDLPEIIFVDVSEMRSGQTMHLGGNSPPGHFTGHG